MLEELKNYLRIDGDEEDNFLVSLLSSSKQFIKTATGKEIDETKDLHKLAIFLFCAHQYENRNPVVSEQSNKLDYSLHSVLFQIEWEEEATE